MQMHSPKEIINNNMSGAVNKANLKLSKMIALGILAGMFIAVGGVTSNTAVHSLSNVSLAKVLAGAVFPIGLLMIVLVGGELFTGNCLMVMATLDKRIRTTLFIRNLVIVFFSNLAGALIMDILIYYSGNLDISGGALGAYTIKVAIDKVHITPLRGITSGLLCNFLVCMAILKGAAAKEVAGKIMATWFPIFAFVLNGFEHIVANMYFIPVGILAKVLAGAVFPIGLLMIVLVGGELFTGNCLMVMATLDKRIRTTLFIRNLVIVFFSNLAGALIMDILIYYSGNLDISGGALGAYTIKVAIDKVHITPLRGITSGLLCNFLVCMAILKGAAAKEVAGKIMATWFPIFAFVLNGFEHIVANMYFIPVGILAKNNPEYVAKAQELYGITANQLDSLDIIGALNNFIPVTFGNLLGGLFIGFLLYFINVKCDKD